MPPIMMTNVTPVAMTNRTAVSLPKSRSVAGSRKPGWKTPTKATNRASVMIGIHWRMRSNASLPIAARIRASDHVADEIDLRRLRARARRRAVGHHAVAHDHHRMAETDRLLQSVRGENDGHPFIGD